MDTTSERSKGTVVTTAASGSSGMKRYPPWLQKALRVKEQSEHFWTQQPESHREPPEQTPSSQAQPNPTAHVSVWDAIAAHDVSFVKEFIESDAQRLFCRWEGVHDGGGGVTLFHEAATHGALGIVAFLLSILQLQFPSETCHNFLNSTDTFGSKTTPLIAACRSLEVPV